MVTAIATCASCTCLNYYKAENCQSPGLFANFSHPTTLALGTVVSTPIYSNQCWTIIDDALDGTPVVDIFDTCLECQGGPTPCDCYEYRVTSISGGVIQYIDCTTGDVVYMDIMANSDQNICVCRDTIVVLAGKIKFGEIGPCDVPENEFIVNGQFSSYDGKSTEYIALLDANGNVQDSFSTIQGGTGFDSLPGAILFTDAIWAGGTFTDYNGTAVQRLIKLDVTGVIDPTYDAATGANNQISTLNKFSDGAIVLTGNLTTFKGTTVNRITCIQPDGTIDSTFVSGTGLNQVPSPTAIIKNDIVYLSCNTSSLVTYKGASGSRFMAIDRQGDRITNYGIAGTNIPLNFGFDVDNLGRVYVVYQYDNKVIVERWLPSGSKDPLYNSEYPLPDLQTSSTLFAYEILVNENYECYVKADKALNAGGYIYKVKSSGDIDGTFDLYNIDPVVGGDTVSIRLSALRSNGLYLGFGVSARLYNGVEVGDLIRVDLLTGIIDPTFNNDPVLLPPSGLSFTAVVKASFNN